MIVRVVIWAALALTACQASTDSSYAAPPVGPRTVTSTETDETPPIFDELDIRLELKASSVRAGDQVGSFLTVRNRSGGTVTDPRCLLASGRYALVPVDDPEAELWQQIVVDCGGPFKMSSGFSDRWAGPSFLARTKFGEALPPGDYIATLEIKGYSQRLAEPIEITD
jgi:hypothetical protein